MMAPAATALGVHLRVLVESPTSSAAQVVVDAPVGVGVRRGGDRPAGRRRRRAHVRARARAERAARPPGGARASRSTRTRPRWCTRRTRSSCARRLTALGVPVPRWAALPSAADLDAFLADARRRGRGEDGPRRVRRQGRPRRARRRRRRGLVRRRRGRHRGAAARRGEGAVHPRARGPGRAAAERRDAHVARRRVGPARRRVRRGGRARPGPRPGDAGARRSTWPPRIADGLGVTGVLAVELFEVADAAGGPPRVLVNELAMRPHNSGPLDHRRRRHQPVRAAPARRARPAARRHRARARRWTVMANVLGSTLRGPDRRAGRRRRGSTRRAKVHLYGKEVRAGRKLGHVNVSGDDLDDVRASGRRRRGPAAGRRVRLTRTGPPARHDADRLGHDGRASRHGRTCGRRR